MNLPLWKQQKLGWMSGKMDVAECVVWPVINHTQTYTHKIANQLT